VNCRLKRLPKKEKKRGRDQDVIGSGDDQRGVIDLAQAVTATLPGTNRHGLFGHGLCREVPHDGAVKDLFYALPVALEPIGGEKHADESHTRINEGLPALI
jgi:hypothetical protein